MSESFQLVRYDAMCRAVAEAFDVDEVKDIRDKAIAMEAYFRQAKNPEPERKACEIRLRAERRAGQLLGEMEKAKRGPDLNGSGQRSQRSTSEDARTLSDLGISKTQSSRWQQLAAVPEEQFESALAAPDKPSTSGVIAAAKPKVEPMDPKALWLWGRLRDFERDGILSADARDLLSKMTDGMKADVERLARLVSEWLEPLHVE